MLEGPAARLWQAEHPDLVARSRSRRFRTGEYLFIAGEPSGSVHLVTSGLFKLCAVTSEGRECIVGLAGPGDLIGDVAALDGGPQPVDAVAACDATTEAIAGERFRALVAHDPKVAAATSRQMSRRIRWMSSVAAERSGTVPARLAGRLLDLADLAGRDHDGVIEIALPLDQSDLGGLAGMSRESACKALGRFRAKRLVRYDRRRLLLLEPDALRRIRSEGLASAPSP